MDFYYIVVQSDIGSLFVGRNSILTDEFDHVRRFQAEQDARDYVARHHIHETTRILRYSE